MREILDELCNPKLEVQRDAIKRVIALMTVGKDVSMLFPQVVNCMQTSECASSVLFCFSSVSKLELHHVVGSNL